VLQSLPGGRRATGGEGIWGRRGALFYPGPPSRQRIVLAKPQLPPGGAEEEKPVAGAQGGRASRFGGRGPRRKRIEFVFFCLLGATERLFSGGREGFDRGWGYKQIAQQFSISQPTGIPTFVFLAGPSAGGRGGGGSPLFCFLARGDIGFFGFSQGFFVGPTSPGGLLSFWFFFVFGGHFLVLGFPRNPPPPPPPPPPVRAQKPAGPPTPQGEAEVFFYTAFFYSEGGGVMDTTGRAMCRLV